MFKLGIEKELESTELPKGMYEYDLPPSKGIDKKHIMKLFGYSDAYLSAYENITGIKIRNKKYYK